jgi:Autographiviridae endonuclease
MHEVDIEKIREAAHTHKRKHRTKKRLPDSSPPSFSSEQRAVLRLRSLGSYEQQQQRAIKALLGNRIVSEKGCWLWGGSYRGPNKCGRVTAFGKQMTAHRASWMAFNGPILNGEWVLRRCDTPLCFNPACLFLGNNQDAVDDMIQRGRMPGRRGENGGGAKLNESQVLEIQDLLDQGVPKKRIARMYPIDFHVICGIAKGELWSQVTGINLSKRQKTAASSPHSPDTSDTRDSATL